MIINLSKFAGISAVALALTTGPVLAQETWEGWDGDADGILTEQEFVEGFNARATFGTWDANADAMLDEPEFDAGVWGLYDRDVTGGLEEAEVGAFETDWAEGGMWYDDENLVENWDVDGDGVILQNEWADSIGEVGLLGAFDANADGTVDEAEFGAGIFDRYDEDGDGVIQEAELTDLGDDMGDEGFWDV